MANDINKKDMSKETKQGVNPSSQSANKSAPESKESKEPNLGKSREHLSEINDSDEVSSDDLSKKGELGRQGGNKI